MRGLRDSGRRATGDGREQRRLQLAGYRLSISSQPTAYSRTPCAAWIACKRPSPQPSAATGRGSAEACSLTSSPATWRRSADVRSSIPSPGCGRGQGEGGALPTYSLRSTAYCRAQSTAWSACNG